MKRLFVLGVSALFIGGVSCNKTEMNSPTDAHLGSKTASASVKTYTFVSPLGGGSSKEVEMQLEIIDGTAYVKIVEREIGKPVQISFNYSTEEIISSREITLDDGSTATELTYDPLQTYYYVFFDQTMATLRISNVVNKFCECTDAGTAQCKYSPVDNKCHQASDVICISSCLLRTWGAPFTGGSVNLSQPGVIVAANQISVVSN